MSSSIFAEIRQASASISERARWVSYNPQSIARYPEILDVSNSAQLEHTEEHHLLHAGDDTLAFFLLLDSINFGSGYFPFLTKDSGVSGYFTIARSLKEWVQRFGIPSAEQLAGIDARACGSIFRQDDRNLHAAELLELFALAWRDLGNWLIRRWNGDYAAVFSHSRSAHSVVQALLEMPFYRDIAVYGHVEVPFLKRAQILIQDVTLAMPGDPRLAYPDLNELTVFADNVLPYVLCADEIMAYHPWLEQRIEREELIGSGSLEEIEIRAMTIHTVSLIADVFRQNGRPISVRELDYYLWNRGQLLKKRIVRKRHRTRCVYY